MQSRMDKYNTDDVLIKSRTEKNKELYEDVKNSSIADYDVNYNTEVIGDNSGRIDLSKVQDFLSDKYSDDTPKRRSIEIPDIDDDTVPIETIQDTKEYDINAILDKAKKGKNVDYSKERLKKVREAQYEILNNLDLEMKNLEEEKEDPVKKAQEDNLINLINTIAELEMENKNKISKETSEAMDLLGLSDEIPTQDEDNDEIKEGSEVIDMTEAIAKALKEEETKKEMTITDLDNVEVKEDGEVKQESVEDTKNLTKENITKDLNKLNNTSSFDFNDVSKRDTISIIIKIIIFLIIVVLIVGALLILNNILDLGLFN